MPKSIHERVRAAIAKREAAAKRAEQVKASRSYAARCAAETRRENRNVALREGRTLARNSRELAVALDGYCGDLTEGEI